MNITTLQLGFIRLDRFVKIRGNDLPALPFAISLLSRGPNLVFHSKVIDFGNCFVLVNTKRILDIESDSLIHALYFLTLQNDGIFTIESKSDLFHLRSLGKRTLSVGLEP
jgi:hypothetical protein